MNGGGKDRRNLSYQIQESIIQLCKAHSVFGGNFILDGIICITGQKHEEMVVKLHERIITPELKMSNHTEDRVQVHPLDILRNYTHSVLRMPPPPALPNYREQIYEGQMLDLSMKKSVKPDINYNKTPAIARSAYNDNRPTADKRPRLDIPETRDVNDMDSADQSNDASPGTDQAENLSLTSEGGSDLSQYSPYSMHRKGASKAERWTQGTPLPSVSECRQCSVTFDNCEQLSEHNEAVHSVFTCQYCHKTFTSRSNLERHLRLHTGFKPYVCAICNKAFSRKDHLSNHSTKHAYKCGHCSKRFPDKINLISHFTYEHASSPLKHCCEYCNRGFGTTDLYEEHIKTHPQYHAVHRLSPVPAVVCDTCSADFPDRLTLLKHRLIHQVNQRCFTCLSCAKIFTDPLLYEDHLIRTHGSESNVYECTLCRQILPSVDALRRHEQLHNNDFDMRGNSPEAGTSVRQLLSSGPRPEPYKYRCLFCNLGFTSYQELCRHMEELRHYHVPRHFTSHHYNSAAYRPPNNNLVKVENIKDICSEDEEDDPIDDVCSDVEVVEPEAPDDINSATDVEERKRVKNSPASAVTNPTDDQPVTPVQSSTPVNGRSHKRKGISPEKYPQDERIKTTDDIYDNFDVESEMSEVSEANISQQPGSGDGSTTSSPYKTERKRERFLQSRMNVQIPDGPFTCSVCQLVIPTFHALEQHSFAEHNRCPCMFCPKTFAQKANRDRHVCLHTGDKPYECGECGEKFSRGDKLKLHRVRTHNLPSATPLSGGMDGVIVRDWSADIGLMPTLPHDSHNNWAVLRGDSGNIVHGGGEWRMIADESGK